LTLRGEELTDDANAQRIVIPIITGAIKFWIQEILLRVKNGMHTILIAMAIQFCQIAKSCVFRVTKTPEVTEGKTLGGAYLCPSNIIEVL